MKTPMTIAAGLVALILSTSAHADRRIFGYVYPYQTLPAGTLELEHYLDLGFQDWDDPVTLSGDDDGWIHPDWRHQVELEYGITDHLDFGFYNVFSQGPFGGLAYDGLKLRSRYRFAEQGELPVDTAIYLEVGYFGDEVKFEEMVIVAKRFGELEISFNGKLEQEVKLGEGEWEFEFLPLLGIGYHFNNNVALSLEYYGKLKVENGEVEYYINYLGPALSVAGKSFYWTIAVQPQIGGNDEKAAVQARSLFGVVF